jgi:WD40 repeat protein
VDFWRSPVISADRKHIYAIGEQSRNQLVSLSGDFPPVLEGLSIDSLSISHDGKWVAFTTYPDGSLWKSRLDGSERIRLSDPHLQVRSPQWTADDSEIFHLRANEGEAWSMARLNLASGAVETLIDRGAAIESYASTPVGERIAYNTVDDSHLGTSNVVILSLAGRKVEAVPQSSDLTELKWSKDGRYLAAVTTNQHALRLFDSETRGWRTVIAAEEVRSIAWDREQNILYFASESGNRRFVRKYLVSNHSVSDVMDLPDRYWHGQTSKVLEMAPKGNLIYGFSHGGTEVYDLNVELP